MKIHVYMYNEYSLLSTVHHQLMYSADYYWILINMDRDTAIHLDGSQPA